MPEKPGKFRPALYGGIILGVLSAIPVVSGLNCLCCAWVLLGGAMSVFFYTKDLTPQMPPLTSGDGVGLGALAGLLGAIVASVLNFFIMLLTGTGTMDMEQWDEITGQVPAESQAIVESLRWIFESPGLLAGVAAIFFLVVFPLFGMLGGLIGYSIFKPKTPVVPPQPPVVPPSV